MFYWNKCLSQTKFHDSKSGNFRIHFCIFSCITTLKKLNEKQAFKEDLMLVIMKRLFPLNTMENI
jgi:hypothetical protein